MKNKNVKICGKKEASINGKTFREKDKIMYFVNGSPFAGVIESFNAREMNVKISQLAPFEKSCTLSLYDIEDACVIDPAWPSGYVWAPDDSDWYD